MTALIIVDMQNDFMPGGPLGVAGANELVPTFNKLMDRFPLVLATLDWHPQDHTSFAANHPGKKPGDIVMVKGISQILWPVHCVRGSQGAELVSDLCKEKIACLFYKGTDKWIDSYSAFFDNARHKATGLEEFLKTREIKEIAIGGVATDYCVLYSVVDALDLGFKVMVISDCCRGINLQPDDVNEAYRAMKEKGAKIIVSEDIGWQRPKASPV